MIWSLFGKYLKASFCTQTFVQCQPECECGVGLCWAWKSVGLGRLDLHDAVIASLPLISQVYGKYVHVLSIFWWRNGLWPALMASWPLVCSLLSSPLLPTLCSELSSQPFAWFMAQFFTSSTCTYQGLPIKLRAACCFRGSYYVHQSLGMRCYLCRFGI